MTCVVGIRTEQGVLLGGDSLGCSGWDAQTRVDPKVFRLGEHVACGFTTSYRMGQLLRFHLEPPTLSHDEYAWAVRDFVPAARAVFKEHGYAKVTDNREQGGTFLLAVRRRLFQVSSDFQVGEAAFEYDAVGCGFAYALGSFHATAGTPTPPASRATMALEAAACFSAGVGAPFQYVEVA